MKFFRKQYIGGPTPMYFAKRLTEQVGGAQIWLKRCVYAWRAWREGVRVSMFVFVWAGGCACGRAGGRAGGRAWPVLVDCLCLWVCSVCGGWVG